VLGTAINSAATKTAGGSQAHCWAATKLLSRLTPTASTTTPMNHLIKRSGLRPGTPPTCAQAYRTVWVNGHIERRLPPGASPIRGEAAQDRDDFRTECAGVIACVCSPVQPEEVRT
jgi:hypothetical protein